VSAEDGLCIHDLDARWCATCLHGPAKPVTPTSTCDCGAEMIWCVTEKNGSRIPIDVEPVPDGKLIKVRVDPNGDRIVRHLTRDEAAREQKIDGPLRYNAHFATCPNADQHRRKR